MTIIDAVGERSVLDRREQAHSNEHSKIYLTGGSKSGSRKFHSIGNSTEAKLVMLRKELQWSGHAHPCLHQWLAVDNVAFYVVLSLDIIVLL